MNFDKLPPRLWAAVASWGGAGLFVAAFLDSSVLSFPMINDLLIVHLSVKSPARMPFYALMATLGSLAGALVLFYLAKKGGELMFRKRAEDRIERFERIRVWMDRNCFLALAGACLLPPPFPFKPFILAAGVLQSPPRSFVLALLIGRGLRYFGEGFLAVRYGAEAERYLAQNKLGFSLLVVALLLLGYLLSRLVFPSSQPRA